MNAKPMVSPEKLIESLQGDFERYATEVASAVNAAQDGQWIAGSEEKVRDLSGELRRLIFEKAVQMRIDAAEAAFPPSAQREDGQAGSQ
jgi:hypothetical protein